MNRRDELLAVLYLYMRVKKKDNIAIKLWESTFLKTTPESAPSSLLISASLILL